jgi:hypothetical protein
VENAINVRAVSATIKGSFISSSPGLENATGLRDVLFPKADSEIKICASFDISLLFAILAVSA